MLWRFKCLLKDDPDCGWDCLRYWCHLIGVPKLLQGCYAHYAVSCWAWWFSVLRSQELLYDQSGMWDGVDIWTHRGSLAWQIFMGLCMSMVMGWGGGAKTHSVTTRQFGHRIIIWLVKIMWESRWSTHFLHSSYIFTHSHYQWWCSLFPDQRPCRKASQPYFLKFATEVPSPLIRIC